MSTPIDHLQRDRRLQEHWLRRIVAIIIDYVIIWVIVWIITFAVAFSMFVFGGFGFFFGGSFLTGIILLFYSAFLEGTRGATIGKSLLRLRVVCNRGPMNIGKALLRNVSKIHWIILLIDLILAFLTAGDPRQRYLDRIVNTTVIDT
ncbi:RDD family protein [[Eubacterium] cellulosolvens]